MNAVALPQQPSLTELEWQVVEIARKDGPRSANPDGRFARFMRDFFGIPVARKLANEKLEALRRFSVRAWYADLIRTGDLSILMDAGYSSSVVFLILTHVARYRGVTPTIQGRPI